MKNVCVIWMQHPSPALHPFQGANFLLHWMCPIKLVTTLLGFTYSGFVFGSHSFQCIYKELYWFCLDPLEVTSHSADVIFFIWNGQISIRCVVNSTTIVVWRAYQGSHRPLRIFLLSIAGLDTLSTVISLFTSSSI